MRPEARALFNRLCDHVLSSAQCEESRIAVAGGTRNGRGNGKKK